MNEWDPWEIEKSDGKCVVLVRDGAIVRRVECQSLDDATRLSSAPTIIQRFPNEIAVKEIAQVEYLEQLAALMTRYGLQGRLSRRMESLARGARERIKDFW